MNLHQWPPGLFELLIERKDSYEAIRSSLPIWSDDTENSLRRSTSPLWHNLAAGNRWKELFPPAILIISRDAAVKRHVTHIFLCQKPYFIHYYGAATDLDFEKVWVTFNRARTFLRSPILLSDYITWFDLHVGIESRQWEPCFYWSRLFLSGEKTRTTKHPQLSFPIRNHKDHFSSPSKKGLL